MENNVSFRDFVSEKYNKNPEMPTFMVKQNSDDFKPIANWVFDTREECLLAIGLMLATPKEMFNLNDFSRTFKFALRMIGNYNSKWAK